MVIKLYGIIFIFVFALAGSVFVQSHGQTMEEIMKEMAEAAKKGEQSQYSGTYKPAPQQTYQPMTPAQSQQYTTDKLLRALSEASRRPQGETDYQRQQRLNNLTNEMRNQDAAISRQQTDYYNARTKRLLGGSPGGSQGNSGRTYTLDELAAPNNTYAQQREQRLNRQGNTASSAQTSNAKPAGFGEGYAGGFKQPKPSGLSVNQSRSSGTAPDWGDDIDDLSAKDEQLKDVEDGNTEYICACPAGYYEYYGYTCFSYDGADEIPTGQFPQAERCNKDAWYNQRFEE